uniref:OSJNBa0089N06.25 protein n=1 Tax=Oryza sativa subsp. japonica TaxID=39947 RepID=Q7F9V9_ORYSJ|nr:OSJNBb0015D13.2 [Oryza sativa Japonica Group]CAE04264.1 OSJNBa0089N06.25 [Oryza sativa Japonica Group]
MAPGAHAPPVLVVVLLLHPHHPCRLRRRAALAAQPIGDGGVALRLAADVVPVAGGAAGARPSLGVGDGGGRDEEVDLAALQLRLRRHDVYPAHRPLLRRALPAKHVVGVRRQHLTGGHSTAVRVDAAGSVPRVSLRIGGGWGGDSPGRGGGAAVGGRDR